MDRAVPSRLYHHTASCRTATEARLFFLQSRRYLSSTRSREAPSDGRTSSDVQSALSYCSNLVRTYDSPSYTLAHFIPRPVIPAYLLVRAFNIEITRIPDVTSNPTMANLRMQFWRDLITSTYSGTPPGGQPIATLLSSLLLTHPLPQPWFLRLIFAREHSLTHPGFPDLPALESYAESTYSTLLYLTLASYPLHSLTADHLASHIGKATGICAVLRGFPFLAFPQPPATTSPSGPLPTPTRQGVITLPRAVLTAHAVRDMDILRHGPAAPNLRDAVFAIATRASDHLLTARSLLANIKANQPPAHEYEHAGDEGHEYGKYAHGARVSAERRREEVQRGFGALLGPAVNAGLWLEKLQKVDFDLFDARLRKVEWRLGLVAWWKSRRIEI